MRLDLLLVVAGGGVDASGGGVDSFGEGGVDVDGLADLVDGEAAGGGDDEFVDEVAGLGSDDGGALVSRSPSCCCGPR